MPADDPEKAIKQLISIKDKFNSAYTEPAEEKEMNLFNEGALEEILNFIGGSKWKIIYYSDCMAH